jgi:hypothetical protein
MEYYIDETTFRFRMDDLTTFARLQLHSQDIDPVYPVLRHIMESRQYGDEARIWQTMLYLAYYNLPSALMAFACMPQPEDTRMMPDWVAKLPTGVERRGLRSPNLMRAHLWSYDERVGEHGAQWLRSFCVVDDTPRGYHVGFEAFWVGVQRIAYNGRWAAFKACDLLKHVLGWPLTFPDMRLQHCSGPLEGLHWCFAPLAPETSNLDELNARAAHIRAELRARGVELEWDQLETVLCDMNSMRKGHYYPGNDIDMMYQQAERARGNNTLDERDYAALLAARRAAIPREYLAEWTGRAVPDRERMRAYADRGRVIGR